ncbi:hypothetical protein [Bradyrhizobium viridifuturi]|uniref:hypothetical protein n=1 Tax=Bradyrhizobium viridifuturi TaxID=1654716 RepID=UPI00067EFB83|nr:hypothetical protein [Bradyrhizobium viridifuturi]
MADNDERYLKIVLDPIRVCAHYRPKFGQGNATGGLTLAEFQTLYRADAFYNWFGLDNPLMYAAHKAAGGMTSVYRQIGIGCEKLFRTVLRDELGLSATDVAWSYGVASPTGGRDRKLSLDGRVPLEKVSDKKKRARVHGWMQQSAAKLGVDKKVFESLTGAVFEVRQGYKSKDSKRQNADIANAAMAYTQGYMPCATILSAQIDTDLVLRYTNERWVVLRGVEGANDPLTSTYDFMRDVVGYDLAGFFTRNRKMLRTEIEIVLKALLAPETT